MKESALQERDRKINLWLQGLWPGGNGDNLYDWVRDYLLRSSLYQCSRCNWGEKNPSTGQTPLEIHHVDGDQTNHLPGNLQVLCPNCHSLTETFRSLNKPIRKRRSMVEQQS